jgi:hypothetical protein
VNIAGTAALLVLLRQRLGLFDLTRTANTVARIVVASAVVAGVAYGCWLGLDDAVGRAFWGQVVSLGIALIAATAVYLGACRVLHVRELDTLLALRGRLKRG